MGFFAFQYALGWLLLLNLYVPAQESNVASAKIDPAFYCQWADVSLSSFLVYIETPVSVPPA